MAKNGPRTRNWVCEFYPESCAENWREILSKYKAACILHDKDIKEDGEQKKPHYHLILTFEGVKSLKQVKAITDELKATQPFVCQDLKAYTRYLVHADNPDKYQYSQNDIITFGGFDVKKAFIKRSTDDTLILCSEIISYIRDNNIKEFSDLIDFCFDNGKEDWALYLTSNRSIWIYQYLKSRCFRSKVTIKQTKKKLSVVVNSDDTDDFYIVDDDGEILY